MRPAISMVNVTGDTSAEGRLATPTVGTLRNGGGRVGAATINKGNAGGGAPVAGASELAAECGVIRVNDC